MITLNDTDIAEKLTVWADAGDETRIHVSISHPLFPPDESGRTRVTQQVSSNPRSADYNPVLFNAYAQLLRRMGKHAPDDVPVHKRHLRLRNQLIRSMGLKPL